MHTISDASMLIFSSPFTLEPQVVNRVPTPAPAQPTVGNVVPIPVMLNVLHNHNGKWGGGGGCSS